VRETADGFLATSAAVTIGVKHADAGVTALRFSGDVERPAGWVSRRYDVKTPTTTLVWLAEISGETTLRTVIDCAQPAIVSDDSANSMPNSKKWERV